VQIGAHNLIATHGGTLQYIGAIFRDEGFPVGLAGLGRVHQYKALFGSRMIGQDEQLAAQVLHHGEVVVELVINRRQAPTGPAQVLEGEGISAGAFGSGDEQEALVVGSAGAEVVVGIFRVSMDEAIRALGLP
jgi:hypothetical protein